LSQPPTNKSGEPVIIRPSTRLVRPFYTLCFVLIGIYFFIVNNNPGWPSGTSAFLVLPGALLVWTLVRHLRLRFVTLKVTGNKLQFEQGFLSKSIRTMELSKVQDVGVSQSFAQRLVGIGDIRVETAGDSSPVSMRSVDNPQAVADFILESVRG